eukprot:3354645-Karenia_brevis.AAC.1
MDESTNITRKTKAINPNQKTNKPTEGVIVSCGWEHLTLLSTHEYVECIWPGAKTHDIENHVDIYMT